MNYKFILGLTALSILAGWGSSLLEKPVFEAKAILYVGQSRQKESLQKLKSKAVLIQSRYILQSQFKEKNSPTLEHIQKNLVIIPNGTDKAAIIYRNDSPTWVSHTANAIGKAFIIQDTFLKDEEPKQGGGRSEKQLKLIQEAAMPSSPIFPNRLLYFFAGMISVFITGCLFFRDSFRSKKEIFFSPPQHNNEETEYKPVTPPQSSNVLPQLPARQASLIVFQGATVPDTTVFDLAHTIGEKGKKVLVIQVGKSEGEPLRSFANGQLLMDIITPTPTSNIFELSTSSNDFLDFIQHKDLAFYQRRLWIYMDVVIYVLPQDWHSTENLSSISKMAVRLNPSGLTVDANILGE
jgi:hypothetical protein